MSETNLNCPNEQLDQTIDNNNHKKRSLPNVTNDDDGGLRPNVDCSNLIKRFCSETGRRENLNQNCESESKHSYPQQTIPVIFNNMQTKVPSIGEPAPQFQGTAVVNGQFKDINLSQYKGKYVVLFFYPMDFTFVCPTEIIAFSDRADDFRKINCEVIAASTDSHYTHLAWINTPRKDGGLGQMNIPLLADKNAKISRDYGIYVDDKGVPLRGLFIIDDKQNLRQITINDLPVGRNVDETIRLVQAFQYTDVHGEVCPVNWKPGSDTIKPGVESSKAYFSKNN